MLQASLQHQLGVEREIRLASYMNEKKKRVGKKLLPKAWPKDMKIWDQPAVQMDFPSP